MVEVRRFATQTRVQIGTLPPGKPAKLKVPADTAPDPWYVYVNGGAPLVSPY